MEVATLVLYFVIQILHCLPLTFALLRYKGMDFIVVESSLNPWSSNSLEAHKLDAYYWNICEALDDDYIGVSCVASELARNGSMVTP